MKKIVLCISILFPLYAQSMLSPRGRHTDPITRRRAHSSPRSPRVEELRAEAAEEQSTTPRLLGRLSDSKTFGERVTIFISLVLENIPWNQHTNGDKTTSLETELRVTRRLADGYNTFAQSRKELLARAAYNHHLALETDVKALATHALDDQATAASLDEESELLTDHLLSTFRSNNIVMQLPPEAQNVLLTASLVDSKVALQVCRLLIGLNDIKLSASVKLVDSDDESVHTGGGSGSVADSDSD